MKIFTDRSRKNFSDFSSVPVILAVIIILLIINDKGTTAAICWLAVVFALSFFMRPYLPSNGVKFWHNAFGLSYGLGLFLCFYTSWTISALGLCDYSDLIIHVCFFLLAAGGFLIKKYALKETYITRTDLVSMLNGFAIFAVIFLAFLWVIGFNPLVDPGTENFMDFGFVQTIYRQKSALPYDPWFGGTKLDHYYYLGQAMVVCMCRLAHTTPEFAYNMMLATFAGMVFSMVAEICYGIAGALFPAHAKKDFCAAFGGITGGAVAAFGANPHWFLYGIIVPALGKLITGETTSYWFPDGTVYINMDVGDPDNGKSEFPAYSTILGDLHAHVIDVLFTLPLLAVLIVLVMSYRDGDKKEKRSMHIRCLVIISLLLGYYKGANYWDFAIYFVITGAVITFTDIKRLGKSLVAAAQIATKAVIVTAVSYVSILPFTLRFAKMESGIGICEHHTPFSKLMVLWAIPVAASVYLIYLLYRRRKEKSIWDATCRIALLAIILCTIGLVITPEVVYVKDIYGENNARFNTMFKLTYQAVVLFGVIYGVLAAVLMYNRFAGAKERKKKMRNMLILVTAYAAVSVSYTPYAAKQWFGDPFKPEERLGISTLDGLEDDETYGFEIKAQKVLMEDDRRVINIVEVEGENYTHECALSVYSGACTYLGWYVHEWMWHNDSKPVELRSGEVRYFYSSSDEDFCRSFLKEHDIDYVFVGPAEVCKYPVYSDVFKQFGDICVSTVWKDRELFLLRVDRSKL